MTSQIYHSGMSYRDSIFTPWNRPNLKKFTFVPKNSLKSEYFAKQIIFPNSPACKFYNDISLVSVLRVWSSSKFPKMGLKGPISQTSLVKSRNQNIFEKFQLNRNLRKISFKMMYNMSMLRHGFSNKRRGGGAVLSYFVKVCIFLHENQTCREPISDISFQSLPAR